jgi:mannose-6-phosphate isomerase-like protein (cupin superfamily)
MSILESPKAFKIELSATKSFQMQGTLWRVLATGADTGGIVGVLDERCARGIAAPMHTHEREDEVFYVIGGDITFFVGEKSCLPRSNLRTRNHVAAACPHAGG